MEATHKEAQWKPLAVARGEVIKELSGHRCLTYWQNLVFADGCDLVAGLERRPRRSNALRDDGVWFPLVPDLATHLRLTFRDALQEISCRIQHELRVRGLPRAQRRKVVRQVLPAGPFPDELIELLRANKDSDAIQRLADEWPLDEECWQAETLYQFLQGKISTKDLVIAIQRQIADVPRFRNFFYGRDERLAQFFGVLRNFGAVLREGGRKLAQDPCEYGRHYWTKNATVICRELHPR
jgi:hypothetical protein